MTKECVFDKVGKLDKKAKQTDKDDELYEKWQSSEESTRKTIKAVHSVLSRPRELDDDDICVRDGYRDIVTMVKELSLAGRTLRAARSSQYDEPGSNEVDPTTRPDYTVMDAVDDARALKARAESASQPVEKAPPSSPAPESASQPVEKAPPSSPAPESASTVQTPAP